MRRPVTLALLALAAVVLVAGALLPAPGPVAAASLPRVVALPAQGQIGVAFRLRFRLQRAVPKRLVGLTVSVYHNGSPRATLTKTYPLGHLASNLYGIAYSSQAAVQGRFCVVVFDGQRHRSHPACASLRVS